MTTLVRFYAINEQAQSGIDEPSSNIEKMALQNDFVKAAEIIYECVQQRKKTTVLCKDQAQAEAFDEFIWAYPEDKFIPHNLYGEGPDAGTPVEIIWQSAYNSMTKLRNTAMVINLSQSFIDKHQGINQIVDFVPYEEALKVAARERYKRYKLAGCQLEYKNL